MAIYKCKMCGGDIEIVDEKIMKCEFCETMQTVPTSSDENLQGLFNRANVLRMKSEFDKAEHIYEKIIEKDETQAEAYWGLILCKYGIEYVEDPNTFKRIPTCHRASFDSIIADEDYKSALNHADSVQRGIYEAEAKEIDRIQKDILELSQKEEPYDVFICYKETDNDGKRTQDSVIANDIYHQLTQEGLKVFYAAITLENKLGKSYEPCIFAALNSAKVMLAIGTKPEYFTAVWVKNEWSRFLKIIQKDRSKLLIPCYRDMDAYELPEEFAHLQAQDMSKIGFINDVVRGIKKVVVPEVKETPVIQQTQVIENANGNITALSDRGFMALEDGEWEKADGFFEQVLNFNAKFAEAYLGKLMAELHVKKQEDLKYCKRPFDDKNNYQKVMRFGDDALKTELQGCIKFINDRNEKQAEAEREKKIEEERIERERRMEEERIERERRMEEERIKAAEFIKVREKFWVRNLQTNISTGIAHTVGLKSDGTVVATSYIDYYIDYCGQCDISGWRDIVAVSAGFSHTVGLKSDGTVVATKFIDDEHDYCGQCDISGWSDIVAISAGVSHTVGLKSDGTVVATKYTGDMEVYSGECDVSEWRDIVAISAGSGHTVGLKSDGTVVATKYTGNMEYYYGQCDVSGWSNIVAISAGSGHTVGLKSDGTVVATKYTGDMDWYSGECNVSGWRDIVAISAGVNHTVGLKSDGTVVATKYTGDMEVYSGECDVSSWKDIVAISVGEDHTVGLKSDGTVVATKFRNKRIDYSGQCDVSEWRDIAIPILADTMEGYKADKEEKRRREEEQRRREEEQRRREEEQRRREEEQRMKYRSAGVCQYCGGTFKGLFTKTCVSCGKKKDY